MVGVIWLRRDNWEGMRVGSIVVGDGKWEWVGWVKWESGIRVCVCVGGIRVGAILGVRGVGICVEGYVGGGVRCLRLGTWGCGGGEWGCVGFNGGYVGGGK